MALSRLLLFVLLHACTLRGLRIIWRSLFEKSDRRTDEAVRWYVALNNTTLTEQKRREFTAWLARDPRHEAELNQVAHVWSVVDETLRRRPALLHLCDRGRRFG
jgi:ferric-dicitrate binding protein FerR (iron transport regulator)